MKLMRFLLIKDNLLSAVRKIEAARNEIKSDGKMTIDLEGRFSNVLAEIDHLEKTVESWDKEGDSIE